MQIRVEHLFFHYQERSILRDLNLLVESGQFLGIIGPNGGGKTTFLKLLLGFLKPSSGVIRLDSYRPTEARKKMAYVPQVLRFDRDFPLSLKELVLQGRLSHLPWYGFFSKEDQTAAYEAIDKVGLSEFMHTPFSALSGGQAQRAIIARAIASNPDLLILDEPTASVDSYAQARIYDLLRQLKGEMTIVMVTHDLEAVVSEVDRVYCIQGEGNVLAKEQVCQHYMIGVYHPPYPEVLS